jgi:hypothetical protein
MTASNSHLSDACFDPIESGKRPPRKSLAMTVMP